MTDAFSKYTEMVCIKSKFANLVARAEPPRFTLLLSIAGPIAGRYTWCYSVTLDTVVTHVMCHAEALRLMPSNAEMLKI
jgi:hypothetical protein